MKQILVTQESYGSWKRTVVSTCKRGTNLETKLLEVTHMSRPKLSYLRLPNPMSKPSFLNVCSPAHDSSCFVSYSEWWFCKRHTPIKCPSHPWHVHHVYIWDYDFGHFGVCDGCKLQPWLFVQPNPLRWTPMKAWSWVCLAIRYGCWEAPDWSITA